MRTHKFDFGKSQMESYRPIRSKILPIWWAENSTPEYPLNIFPACTNST